MEKDFLTMKSEHRNLVEETEILRKEFNRFAAGHEKMGKQLNKEMDEFKERNDNFIKKYQDEWLELKVSNLKTIDSHFERNA